MVPRIDFYIMTQADERACLDFVCRLIEKAYKQNHRIYVHTDTQLQAHELDEKLWTYRDDSFLPHNLYGEGPSPPPPIQIGFNSVPEKQRDILINLSQSIPSFYRQFSRILELVMGTVDRQALSREHYRVYRAAGHEINTHKISTIEA